MTRGDRVVVLASENRGRIVGFQADGTVLVERDDLPPELYGPLPYDPHELEVVTTAPVQALQFANQMARYFASGSHRAP